MHPQVTPYVKIESVISTQIWDRVCLHALIQRLHLRDLRSVSWFSSGSCRAATTQPRFVTEVLWKADIPLVVSEWFKQLIQGLQQMSHWVNEKPVCSTHLDVPSYSALYSTPYFSGTTVLVLLGWYFLERVMKHISNFRILRQVKGAWQVFLNWPSVFLLFLLMEWTLTDKERSISRSYAK